MKSLSAFVSGCAAVILIVACGGSSGGTIPGGDSGSGSDGSGKDVATHDTGKADTASSGSDTGSTGSTGDSGGDVAMGTDAPAETGASCAAIGTGAKQFNITGTCASCIAANCCATLTTCVGNAQCLALIDCAAKCAAMDAGMSCEDNCGVMHLGGVPDAMKFGNCESSMCKSQCG